MGGPVNEIKKSEIGNKYQSHSRLNFGELVLAEVLKNKKSEEKEFLLGKKTEEKESTDTRDYLDEARLAMVNSFAIMNTFLPWKKSIKKEEVKNERSK